MPSGGHGDLDQGVPVETDHESPTGLAGEEVTTSVRAALSRTRAVRGAEKQRRNWRGPFGLVSLFFHLKMKVSQHLSAQKLTLSFASDPNSVPSFGPSDTVQEDPCWGPAGKVVTRWLQPSGSPGGARGAILPWGHSGPAVPAPAISSENLEIQSIL